MTHVSDNMTVLKTFSETFKKLRLQSGINSLRELCELLTSLGFILEESTLSRWQNGSRVPKNRALVLGLIKIFAIREALSTVEEANKLLYLADLFPLSEEEEKELSLKSKKHLVFFLPPKPNIIGIEYVQAEVRRLVSQNKGHLRLLLWGLPGTGKSSTAISLGHEFQSFFQKGTIWIRVLDKSITQVDDEITEILNNSSLPEGLNKASLLVKSQDFLIIFDNVNSEQVLSDIVKNYAFCSYLITTNFQPKVQNHFSVVNVGSFDNEHAIELFTRISGRALTINEIKFVCEISNQLGNLPLPLSIVANALQGSLNEINLKTTLKLLKMKQKGLSFFQDNFSQIISAFELLFDQLSSNEKEILETIGIKRLSIFDVSDLVTKRMNHSQAQWVLFTLNGKSMIDKTAQNNYRIHPILYRFLRIKFAESKSSE